MEAKRRALDEIAARQCAADGKRKRSRTAGAGGVGISLCCCSESSGRPDRKKRRGDGLRIPLEIVFQPVHQPLLIG